MKIYYIANARMPNEKAHGIQIAKMCEAFIEAGVDLTLVVPRRWKAPADMQSFYTLRIPVPLVQLRIPKLYVLGTFGFFVSSLFFMMRYSFFLILKRFRGEHFLIYTVDMDSFSSALLPLLGRCVTEMHTPKPASVATRFFFKRVQGVIATNPLIREALAMTFAIPPECLICEPNGVDIRRFSNVSSQEEARRKLLLPTNEKLALYIGRMYEWKGLEIISEATVYLAEQNITLGIVGATRAEFETVVKKSGEGIVFFGSCSSAQVPIWLAAADVFFILGTKRDEASYRYTAPMKIFEYMAAQRPIVASRTPALSSMITDEVLWYEPGNANDFACALIQAMEHPDHSRITRALALAQYHSWSARAQRIIHFIEHYA